MAAVDDAIALLMQEMGEQQYGDEPKELTRTTKKKIAQDDPNSTNNILVWSETYKKKGEFNRPRTTDINNTVARCRRRRRIVSELPDYPNNTHLAGSQCIWNPWVQGMSLHLRESSSSSPPSPSSSTSTTTGQEVLKIMLPTNPTVEIVRRRSFEKFRREMQEMLQRMTTSWEKQYHNQQLNSNKYNNSKNNGLALPVAQMLEKFVMDAKLQEQQSHKVGVDSNSSLSPLLSVSTMDILRQKNRLLSTSSPNTNTVYDPVLLSRQAPSMFVNSIVRPQVQKSWQVMVSSNQISSSSSSSSSSAVSNLPPKFEKKASQIQKATYKFVVEAHDSFDKQLQSAAAQEIHQAVGGGGSGKGHKSNNSSSRRPKIVVHDFENKPATNHEELARVTFAGVSFKLHSGYLEKLQRLYDRAHDDGQEHMLPYPLLLSDNNSNDHGPSSSSRYISFEEALFCLLCRYDTIQGAGLQASVPGSVMDVLLKYFDCRLECFASPLNCRYDRYCSAFEDVDVAFGSHGSFFKIPDESFLPIGDSNNHSSNKNRGTRCYEANPPFCEGLIKQLDAKINRILALQTQSPVMFVVIVPAWEDTECYQGLLNSPFLKYHLFLKQRKHYYSEGTQHRRKDSFRVASFDTSVLFYQNGAAAKYWPLDEGRHEAVVALKTAFEENPGAANKNAEIKYLNPTIKAATSTACHTSTNTADTKAADKKIDRTVLSNEDDQKHVEVVKTVRRKASNKEKKEKKRRWAEQGEGEAHLELLQSLGIAEQQNPSDNSPERVKSKKKKRQSLLS
jgi:Phosphorylated CTD interacting factor 1 WW domain